MMKQLLIIMKHVHYLVYLKQKPIDVTNIIEHMILQILHISLSKKLKYHIYCNTFKLHIYYFIKSNTQDIL
jgi:hypothetical protein